MARFGVDGALVVVCVGSAVSEFDHMVHLVGFSSSAPVADPAVTAEDSLVVSLLLPAGLRVLSACG